MKNFFINKNRKAGCTLRQHANTQKSVNKRKKAYQSVNFYTLILKKRINLYVFIKLKQRCFNVKNIKDVIKNE